MEVFVISKVSTQILDEYRKNPKVIKYIRTMTLKEDLKKRALAEKGNRCLLCGYNRCLASLHFHHLNSFEKNYAISTCTSWRQIKAELPKCVLVCANCHAEIHAGLVDLELLMELEYS